jgi:two-component system chemotaxis sensor kinase CheA
VSRDPLRYFRVEARELIDQISAGVLDLDQQPGPELVARLLRFAHTLKGAARVVRQQDIADRAHAFEEVLVPHRAATGPVPADEIRQLLRLNDEIEAHVVALEPGPDAAGPDAADAGQQVNPDPAGPGPAGPGPAAPGPAGPRPAGVAQAGAVQAGADQGSQGPASTGQGPIGRSQDAPVGGATAGGGVTRSGTGATPESGAAGPGPRESQPGSDDGVGPGQVGPGQVFRGQAQPGTTQPGQTGPAYLSDPDPALGPTDPADDPPARPGGEPMPSPPAQPGNRTQGDRAQGNPAQGAQTQDTQAPGSPTRPGATPQQPGTPRHGGTEGGDTAASARNPSSDVDELLDAVGEAHARFAPLRAGTHAMERLRRAAESLADQLRPAAGRAASTAAPTETARAAAVRLAADLSDIGRRLTDTVEQVERELDEVRGRAERLRLVAASGIFTALHRAVRDAADAQDKRVIFAGHGGDLRMDPQVLAQASSALLHVVRNAVAHGIEGSAERLAAGKPAEGRVVVEVERRRRYAAFRCSDDGRGFDLDAVRRTAEARGLLPPGGAADQQTLVDLVLRGGISTSSTVTDVAGRGIGLDVARDVAEQLGGEVTVITAKGTGTTVELVVPLSLLSLHGLVVQAAGQVATIPLDSVRTCVRLLPAQATSAAAVGRIAYDGQALPFLALADALAAGAAATPPRPDDPAAATGASVAVIVAADDDLVAIGVDRLAGTSILVVRPLPDLAPAVPAVGGVSMDLDGNPRLVLDAQGLIAEAQRHDETGGTPAPRAAGRRPILVVDDSLTTRMLERSILESAGYAVDLAASGEEGLEMAHQRAYCLYLTDIDMPGIDGFTFIERTKADPELAAVPAILVSSRSSADDRVRGAAIGASAFVVKGEFDQEELLAHIRKLVPA